MTKDFETLASEIKKKLELRFSKEALQDIYIYNELDRITKAWKQDPTTKKKTDIGVAAVKFFDSGSREDEELAGEISKLARIFNRSQIK